MDASAATDGQKSRELKRKAQLREAQRRLRQRKMDALKDANSEIEDLRKQLADAKETIARLESLNDSPVTDEIITPDTTNYQQDIEKVPALSGQVYMGGIIRDNSIVGELLTPLSPSTLESFFPGASNDLLSIDMPDAFPFSQLNSTTRRSPTPDSMSGSLGYTFGQVWPLGYTAVLDDHVPYMPLSTFSDGPSSPAAQLVQQPVPPSYTPIRGPTFAKRLWRRCAEAALRILADTKKHQSAIERAFGAYFDRFSPEVTRRSLTAALSRDNFGELEYHNYPSFSFGARSGIVQDLEAEKLMSSGQLDTEDDPYMTPRDIENYFVWNGQLRQSVDSKGNVVTLPCHFDFQGKRWVLDENRLIHILMHLSVCLGQGPAILASQVIAATFQSMQRVSIQV
ncbi:hypothetical protein E4T50_12929 [Aureobasidium sp. EXF-12298]|nr:hypothetical protein E4T50_12929 [Aureobasidium sp. EXF-12298]